MLRLRLAKIRDIAVNLCKAIAKVWMREENNETRITELKE
jgi:hypothetical protein